MRKIGKGLILTALFAVCTVGMIGLNLDAATLQNKDQKSYDIEIMTDGQIPGADSSTTEAPTTEEPTTEKPTDEPSSDEPSSKENKHKNTEE